MDSHQGERRLEHRRQKLLTDPAERETGEGDSGVAWRKGMRRDARERASQNRAKISLIDQGIELAAAT